MSALAGFDRYSGSDRKVSVRAEGAHVVLSVECTSGSNEGEAMLTPEQAIQIGKFLQQASNETGLRYVEEA